MKSCESGFEELMKSVELEGIELKRSHDLGVIGNDASSNHSIIYSQLS